MIVSKSSDAQESTAEKNEECLVASEGAGEHDRDERAAAAAQRLRERIVADALGAAVVRDDQHGARCRRARLQG